VNKKKTTIASLGHVGNKPIELTNALTLIHDSQEYFKAAKELINMHPDKILVKPKYFLILRSIELGFKSLLKIKEGISTDKLRNKYGHNLTKLMAYCIKNEYIKLSKIEEEAIKLVSDYYENKGMEYTAMGNKEIPTLKYYIKIAEKLHHTFANIANNVNSTKYM